MVLQSLYTEVLIPLEVCQEILTGGRTNFAVAEFEAANWLQKRSQPLTISPSFSVKTAIEKMRDRNIRLSQTVIDFALREAGECELNLD
jgi:predicted nucleic acid-binding protein